MISATTFLNWKKLKREIFEYQYEIANKIEEILYIVIEEILEIEDGKWTWRGDSFGYCQSSDTICNIIVDFTEKNEKTELFYKLFGYSMRKYLLFYEDEEIKEIFLKKLKELKENKN